MPSTSIQADFLQSIIPIHPEIIVLTVALLVLVLDFFIEKESKGLPRLVQPCRDRDRGCRHVPADGSKRDVLRRHVPSGRLFHVLQVRLLYSLRTRHPVVHQLSEDRGHPPGRILRPDAVRHERHDAHGLGRRPDHALPRARAHGPVDLYPGRIYEVRQPFKRGRDQIPAPGRLLVGHHALRHVAAVRPYRHDQSDGDPGHSCATRTQAIPSCSSP